MSNPVKTYKVAFMRRSEPSVLYSRMVDTYDEAKRFAKSAGAKGYEALIFERSNHEPSVDSDYSWKLMPGAGAAKFKRVNQLTSLKVLVPVALGVIVILMLKRGIPKRIA